LGRTVTAPPGLDRRVARLLRWYPRTWRDRYGDEFAAFLRSELSERPRSPVRTFDVARAGVNARLARAGLTNPGSEDHEHLQAGLATVAGALAVFLAFGTAMWSQLTIGWQWSQPATAATTTAVLVMSATMVLFTCLAAAAVAPVLASAVRQIRPRASVLVRPSLLCIAGAVLLVVGARHFGNGWPGTGGHHWAHRGLVPGGVLAFGWASTLWITSYWAHPAALAAFPRAELWWMATSPVATACVVVGAVKVTRRLELSPRVLHYERFLAWLACLAMVVLMGGASSWIVDGGAGPRDLFRAGSIDTVAMAMMATSLLVVYQAVHRGGRRSPVAG
jgi:hypothetical protein